MIKNKSKNLFDGITANVEIGNVMSSTPVGSTYLQTQVSGDTRLRVIELIPINANTQYTVSVSSNYDVGYLLFDTNKLYTGNFAFWSNSFTITTSSTERYIALLFRFDTNATITPSEITSINAQLELGSTATAYVPYNDIQVAVGQFEQGQGKNLFDKGAVGLELGFIDPLNGLNVSATIESRTIGYIKTLPNQQYSVSFLNSGKQVRRAYFYDINFNYLGNVDARSGTFTTLSNTNYLRLTPRFIDLRNLTTLDILELENTLQLELGNTATTYEPYKYLAIHNPASNDIPIPALNNKTLNEVFVGGQLFLNPNFDNTSNYTIQFNGSITNGNLTFPTFNPTITTQTQNHGVNNVMYYTSFSKRDNTTGGFGVSFLNTANALIGETQIIPLTDIYSRQSGRITLTDNVIAFRIGRVVGNSNIFIDEHKLYNLTSLGIASQTQAQMDAYFEAWQRNNAGTLLANTFIQHDQNSVPIADLNGKTLDEVFIGGNLVVNGGFDGSTNWTLNQTSIVDNQLSFDNTLGHTTLQTGLSIPSGTSFYTTFIARKTTVNIPRTYAGLFLNSTSAIPTLFEHIISTDTFATYSSIQTTSTTANRIQIGRYNTVGSGLLDDLYLINLTALGITATKEQLDFWYSVWQQNHKLGMRVHRASGNDIPLAVLNNQSLNQVFVGGQLINNANWAGNVNTSVTISGTEIIGFGNGTGTELRISQGLFIPISNSIYINYNYKSNVSTPANYLCRYVLSSGTLIFLNTTTNTFSNYVNLSSKNTLSNNALRLDFNVIKNNIPSTEFVAIKDVILLDLTSLGIATLTKSQLDYLFQVWQFNNLNALVARQFIQEA